jgi:hypothetical protein
MIAYRHHLFYDKLTQGKVLCSRALLEKDYAKKFIHKKFDHFKDQLELDAVRAPSKLNHTSPKALRRRDRGFDSGQVLSEEEEEALALGQKTMQELRSPQTRTDFEMNMSKDSKQLEFERDQEVNQMFDVLMKSQLTVVSISLYLISLLFRLPTKRRLKC